MTHCFKFKTKMKLYSKKAEKNDFFGIACQGDYYDYTYDDVEIMDIAYWLANKE